MNEDASLLRRYAEERSETAFADLVRRHIDLVYSAAQRVFTRLARDASRLASHPVLTAWLYTATRNAALDLLRSEQRRRAREQEAHAMHELSSSAPPGADWEKLRPVLDGVVDELGETDRAAVLLRFFEQRSFAEIGAALNVSQDAARMRTERALDKLRALLAKRGVTSTAGALAAMLASQAAATAPAGLAASVTATAVQAAMAAAGAGSVGAVLYFMSISKIGISLAAAAALAIATAVYQWKQVNEATERLARKRGEHAALSSRLAAIRREVNELAANAQHLAPIASPAVSASRAEAAPNAETEKARQDKALKQFLANDPEWRRMQVDLARLAFLTNHAPFFASIGASPEQISQAAQLVGHLQEQTNSNLAAGREPASAGSATAVVWENEAGMRAAFGDAAMSKWKEEEWSARVVRRFATEQYFTGESITRRQASELADLIRSSSTGKANRPMGNALLAVVDWEQVVSRASAILTPTQLHSLQGFSAYGRNAVLMATMEKQAAENTR